VLGPTIVHAGAFGCLVFASYNMDMTDEGPQDPPCTPHFYFLFFLFATCFFFFCNKRTLYSRLPHVGGGQGTLLVLVKNVMYVRSLNLPSVV
jgi:hypothetical protein